MKKTILAVILLLGVIFLCSCQKQDNPPSVSDNSAMESLLGRWVESNSGTILTFLRGKCIMHSDGRRDQTYTCRVYGNHILLTPLEGGKELYWYYRFSGDKLILGGKTYEKMSD